MKDFTLYGCVIFYNDTPELLEAALKSLKTKVDYIVAIDGPFREFPFTSTYSTDGCLEIAKLYADKVIEGRIWHDQMAKRNACFMGQNKDYYLILDADETLEGEIDKMKLPEHPMWILKVAWQNNPEHICTRIFEHGIEYYGKHTLLVCKDLKRKFELVNIETGELITSLKIQHFKHLRPHKRQKDDAYYTKTREENTFVFQYPDFKPLEKERSLKKNEKITLRRKKLPYYSKSLNLKPDQVHAFPRKQGTELLQVEPDYWEQIGFEGNVMLFLAEGLGNIIWDSSLLLALEYLGNDYVVGALPTSDAGFKYLKSLPLSFKLYDLREDHKVVQNYAAVIVPPTQKGRIGTLKEWGAKKIITIERENIPIDQLNQKFANSLGTKIIIEPVIPEVNMSLYQKFIDPKIDYIVIQPGGFSESWYRFKCYPYFKELIKELQKRFPNKQIVLMGHSNDYFDKSILKLEGIINLIGKLDADEMWPAWLSILYNADFVITSDTGIGHLSVILGIKTYRIFGSTPAFLHSETKIGEIIKSKLCEFAPCYRRYSEKWKTCEDRKCLRMSPTSIADVIAKKEISKFQVKETMETEEGDVSILVAAFNEGQRIKEFLDSVLNQRYKKWIMMFIDDGSIDDTMKIVSKYAEKDKRIKIHGREARKIETPLRSCSKAWNVLLRRIKTPYFTIVGADDKLHPDYLWELVSVMKNEPDILAAACWLKRFGKDNLEIKEDRNFIDLESFLLHQIELAQVLWRKKAIQMIGNFDARLPRGQSWDYIYRFLKKGGRIKVVPKVLYYFRYWRKIYSKTGRYYKMLAMLKEGETIEFILQWNTNLNTLVIAIEHFLHLDVWKEDSKNSKLYKMLEERYKKIFEESMKGS